VKPSAKPAQVLSSVDDESNMGSINLGRVPAEPSGDHSERQFRGQIAASDGQLRPFAASVSQSLAWSGGILPGRGTG
jgi:hypothetical protein